MEKWIGILLILLGAAAGVWQWRSENVERQNHLRGWILFLHRASYAMEEKQNMTELFLEFQSEDVLLQKTLKLVVEYMRQNCYPSGDILWKRALRVMEWNKQVSTEQMRILDSLGNAFFGRNRTELRALIDMAYAQLEDCLTEEQMRFAKNQRTVMPVGMLGSVLLILLLL